MIAYRRNITSFLLVFTCVLATLCRTTAFSHSYWSRAEIEQTILDTTTIYDGIGSGFIRPMHCAARANGLIDSTIFCHDVINNQCIVSTANIPKGNILSAPTESSSLPCWSRLEKVNQVTPSTPAAQVTPSTPAAEVTPTTPAAQVSTTAPVYQFETLADGGSYYFSTETVTDPNAADLLCQAMGATIVTPLDFYAVQAYLKTLPGGSPLRNFWVGAAYDTDWTWGSTGAIIPLTNFVDNTYTHPSSSFPCGIITEVSGYFLEGKKCTHTGFLFICIK